jgi:hypothetical protein
MKSILVIEALTLILLWACTIYLYVSTGELSAPHLLSGAAMSISSLGTGFILYNTIKEWKSLNK